jgi:hypothetical protein
MTARKDLKEIARAAENQGWRIVRRRGGHLAFYAPDGKHIVHSSATPSDYRATANLVAELRKHGFRLEGTLTSDMEFRITITVGEHGVSEDSASTFLDGFLATHPETGPVVSQDRETGSLSVTFALPADDANQAIDRARRVFRDGVSASGLEPSAVLGVEAVLVSSRNRSLQPA